MPDAESKNVFRAPWVVELVEVEAPTTVCASAMVRGVNARMVIRTSAHAIPTPRERSV